MAPSHPHPYFPRDVELPGYQPQLLGVAYIFPIFAAVMGWIGVSAWILAGRVKYITKLEKALVSWFICTGLIHFVIEGHVVLRSKFYQDTTCNILDEGWKEYSKADSRYATRDSFIVTMEAVTAFIDGPACFAIVYAIVTRRAWRFTAILLTSLAQFYGDALYFLTSWHAGFGKHSRPEAAYFWGYFVCLNTVWLLVPLSCIIYAARKVNAAVCGVEGQSKQKSQ